jgi:hypothetical protein
MIEPTNWGDFYSPEEAIEVLRRNSNKPDLHIGYLRTLARPSYGKLHPKKVGNVNMYPKAEVDAYVVEERGEKAGRARKLRGRKARKLKEAA